MRNFLKKLRSRFEWKRNIRKLEVTLAGKWYIALTIALGVTALVSGNNAIYLMESLLLAGLILSGVQSEKQVSSVHVDFLRFQAKSEEPTGDWVIVRNEGNRTLYCLEIGEWKEGHFEMIAFFPKIQAHETARARSTQKMLERGAYRWGGFAIATSFPFGFARKIKVVRKPGERIVWPKQSQSKIDLHASSASRKGNQTPELEVIEGEIRPYDWTDDARMIIANQSFRGLGPMVRNRRPVQKEPEIIFDTRVRDRNQFETAIQTAAQSFYNSGGAELILIQNQSRKRIVGKNAALNALSVLKPEDSR